MKYIIAAFFILCTAELQAQDSATYRTEVRSGLLLDKISKKTITEEEQKELKLIAFDFQNRGQLLDEGMHDYKGALVLINKSIGLFEALQDTLNEANNRKYKGYLLGRFGDYSEAKAEIGQATAQYRSKEKDWGVAVCQFDLARVYDFEKKTDSAIHYCNVALGYWKTRGTESRIFGIQNMLLHLLMESNDGTNARLLQKEAEKLAIGTEPHWQDLLDFYFVSAQLFRSFKETERAQQYEVLYSNKVNELVKDGRNAKAYYDIAKK